jgi:hypothetical protein
VKVIMAKDSAFIPTLKDGDFPLCPSQSYQLKTYTKSYESLKDEEAYGLCIGQCPENWI